MEGLTTFSSDFWEILGPFSRSICSTHHLGCSFDEEEADVGPCSPVLFISANSYNESSQGASVPRTPIISL